MMEEPLLRASHLSCSLRGRSLLKDVSFDLPSGQLVGIIGPNGAGKSTLLRLLAGGLVPDSGAVFLAGRPLTDWTLQERARRISWLPQHPLAAWPMQVAEIVALGRLPYGSDTADAAVTRAMDLCGLTDLAQRAADTLSGGETARMLLARALAVEAPVFLADEPVAALDPGWQHGILRILKKMADAGVLILVVLHDLALAARYCHRLLLVRDGTLVAGGPAEDVMRNPLTEQTFGVTLRAVSEGWIVLPQSED
jgi:iron complex transport system ATP-binding protein